ncbi:response regulator [Thermodesulfobacteriota bacterium]
MDSAPSVLIVDDDVGMIKTLGYILKEKGFKVQQTDKGSSALALIKEKPFNIVLSDIKMPGLNGVELLREIKKIAPSTCVIMMTAYTNNEMVAEAKLEGAREVYFKPLDLDVVVSFMEQIRHNQQQPASAAPPADTALPEILAEKTQQLLSQDKLIEQLKNEIASIKTNPEKLVNVEIKKKHTENIVSILNEKQTVLFELLSGGEKNYEEMLEEFTRRKLGVRELDALRLLLSRFAKKLEKDTFYQVKRVRRNKVLYFTLKRQAENGA